MNIAEDTKGQGERATQFLRHMAEVYDKHKRAVDAECITSQSTRQLMLKHGVSSWIDARNAEARSRALAEIRNE